jgi:hypothetical protein
MTRPSPPLFQRPPRGLRDGCLGGVLGLVLMLAACQALAQDVTVLPGGVELEERLGVPAAPGDVAGTDAETEDDGASTAGSREFLIAPLPSRNPLFGWTFALPALWLYEPEFSQSGDTPWVTGAGAFYAENESLGVGLFHKMSLGGDQWRVMAAAFTADLRYDYFGIGGRSDRALPLKQDTDLLLVEGLYRFRPNMYLGLQAMAASTTTGLDLPADLLPPGTAPPELFLDIDLVNLAPKFVFDTRDNPFYPRDGWLVEGTVSLSRTAFGGDVDYERHDWAMNRYFSLTERGTLAVRVSTQYVGGDAPFFVVPAFGAGSDLRGYQTGTYRDRFLFAAQAEWRQRLSSRWGAVAFAGLGTVAPEFGSWGDSLPAGGVGLRWVAAPKNNLSVRVDVAWGRGENEFYVSIGEAF